MAMNERIKHYIGVAMLMVPMGAAILFTAYIELGFIKMLLAFGVVILLITYVSLAVILMN